MPYNTPWRNKCAAAFACADFLSVDLKGDQGGRVDAVIVDGRVPHVLLLELFTEHGTGTLIRLG